MHKHNAVLVCLLMFCGVLVATPTNREVLEKYRRIYDDSLAEFETAFREASRQWPQDYRDALKALRVELQAAGDLDGWEIVNRELMRFQETPTAIAYVESSAQLRMLQKTYFERAAQLKTEKASASSISKINTWHG